MPKTILIADDEPHMVRIIELSLKKAGYGLRIARHGREALEMAIQEPPALIVMDVAMPEMDGLTALRQLKANPATIAVPVIMLTSRGQTIARDEAEASGASLYLTKPFSPSGLAAEVRRLIGPPAE